MFAASNLNFCYLATSAGVWIFFVLSKLSLFHWQVICFVKFDITWYPQFTFVSISTIGSSKCLHFQHFFSIFRNPVAISSNRANCQQLSKLTATGKRRISSRLSGPSLRSLSCPRWNTNLTTWSPDYSDQLLYHSDRLTHSSDQFEQLSYKLRHWPNHKPDQHEMVIRRVRHEAKHIPEHADEFDFEPEHEFWCTTHPLINLLSQFF